MSFCIGLHIGQRREEAITSPPNQSGRSLYSNVSVPDHPPSTSVPKTLLPAVNPATEGPQLATLPSSFPAHLPWMTAGAIPSIQPPRSVPGKAVHVGRPLHFLLAAYGVGGTRVHRASAPPCVSPGGTLTFPGTTLTLSSALLPCRRRSAGLGRAAVLDGRLFAGRRSTLPPTFFFPSWLRRSGWLLPLPGQGGQGRSFLGAEAAVAAVGAVAGGSSATLTMSGSVDGAAGIDGGEAPSADMGGKTEGGEASGGGTFPIVTLDADAVQKFAEIEVRWGE